MVKKLIGILTLIGIMIWSPSFGADGDPVLMPIVLQEADPAIVFDGSTTSDTDYWMGITADEEGDDDDLFQIGKGTTKGTTPFLTIDKSGNIGIGTPSPSLKFDIIGDVSIAGDDGWNGAGDLAILRFGTGDDDVGIAGRYGGIGWGGLIFGVYKSSGGGYLGANSYNAMVIEEINGYVGISTTDPNALLHIAKDLDMSASLEDNQFRITGSTNANKRLVFGFDTTDNFGYIQAGEYDVSYRELKLNPDGGNVSVGSGAIDFGSSSSLEIPNSANPTTDATGEIAFDSDDMGIEIYDGTVSALYAMKTKTAQAVIWDPDVVQATEDAIPILTVESTWAPHGITITSLYIKVDASSTYSVVFEEWTSPTSGVAAAIETVATSSSTEAESTSIDNPTIEAGNIVFVNLPTTAVNFLHVTINFYINSGD